MSSLAIGFIFLVCMLSGMVLGGLLRHFLPEHHVQDDSRDVMKTAAGMMATLVALIIGLLVSSSKTSFDTTSAGLTQSGAKIITLDRILSRYGSDAKGIRGHLKQTVASGVERIWPSDSGKRGTLAEAELATGMEDVFDEIRELSPPDDARQYLKSQALQLSGDLLQSRWMLLEQSQNTVPTLFLVVLASWLGVLFASFGLLAPRNVTAMSALFICALSVSGAIFLILELNRPLEGTIKASSAPLLKALSIIDK